MRVMTMFSWVRKLITSIWSPVSLDAPINSFDIDIDIDIDIDEDDSVGGSSDPYIWYMDLKKHAFGEFSYAVVQADEELLDFSQVEIGLTDTFLGIYDGYGGPEVSSYLYDNFFPMLLGHALEKRYMKFENRTMLYAETLRQASWIADDAFCQSVNRTHDTKKAVGSCLVGVISRRRLFVSNVGDSRVVIGKLITRGRLTDIIVADQITKDQKTFREDVRRKLKRIEHGGDQQVSTTIGEAKFTVGFQRPNFYCRLKKPILRPIMRYDADECARELHANDKFVVFASHGFWEHITNQQAVEIVHYNPKSGIARRLLKAAMTEAANKMHKKYKDLKNMDKEFRRFVHKDMTVIVVFIDYELLENWYISPSLCEADQASVKCFSDLTRSSMFSKLPKYPFRKKT